MSLHDLPRVSYKLLLHLCFCVKLRQFKILTKDIAKLHLFLVCFTVHFLLLGLDQSTDTKRNFALRDATLPIHAQPAPVLLSSSHVLLFLSHPKGPPFLSLPWELLATTSCQRSEGTQKYQKIAPHIFFLPSNNSTCSAQWAQHEEHRSRLMHTDSNLQPLHSHTWANGREQRALPLHKKQHAPVTA